VIVAGGIYTQTAAWAGLGFEVIKQGALAHVEGVRARAKEIVNSVTKPWREDEPTAAAAQVGTLAGIGLSFSPGVKQAAKPVGEAIGGIIKKVGDKTLRAAARAAVREFVRGPTLGEGSRVLAATSREFDRVRPSEPPELPKLSDLKRPPEETWKAITEDQGRGMDNDQIAREVYEKLTKAHQSQAPKDWLDFANVGLEAVTRALEAVKRQGKK